MTFWGEVVRFFFRFLPFGRHNFELLTETSRLESVFYVLTKYFGRLPEAVELSEVERF